MTKLVARDPIYRRRRLSPETIELCVRWYITYRLSYRDFPGAWMKPPWRFAVAGTTYIAQWTGMGSPSRHCSASIEAWCPRHSS